MLGDPGAPLGTGVFRVPGQLSMLLWSAVGFRILFNLKAEVRTSGRPSDLGLHAEFLTVPPTIFRIGGASRSTVLGRGNP